MASCFGSLVFPAQCAPRIISIDYQCCHIYLFTNFIFAIMEISITNKTNDATTDTHSIFAHKGTTSIWILQTFWQLFLLHKWQSFPKQKGNTLNTCHLTQKKKPKILNLQHFVYFLYFLLAINNFFCYYINVVSRNDYFIVRRCQNGKM